MIVRIENPILRTIKLARTPKTLIALKALRKAYKIHKAPKNRRKIKL